MRPILHILFYYSVEFSEAVFRIIDEDLSESSDSKRENIAMLRQENKIIAHLSSSEVQQAWSFNSNH